MNFNIIIPTRDRPNNIIKIIKNIGDLNLSPEYIIIIDDSRNEMNSIHLEKIINSSKKIRIKLLNKKNVNHLFKNKKTSYIGLGKRGHNLGNARNLGLIYSFVLSGYNVINLLIDDDMELNESIKHILDINPKNTLAKIELGGSPDLSRLEWIQFFLKSNKPSILIKNSYINKLVKVLDKRSFLLLNKYTDLKIPSIKKNLDIIRIPQREELSGGCCVFSSNLILLDLFPNWFDEDWCLFDKLRRNHHVKIIKSKINVCHNSLKKNILNLDLMLFEERGKILTNALKKMNLLRIKKFDTKKLLILEIMERIEIINSVILVADHSLQNNLFKRKILNKLLDLKREVQKLDPNDLLEEIEKFIDFEKHFKQDIKKNLNPIKEDEN